MKNDVLLEYMLYDYCDCVLCDPPLLQFDDLPTEKPAWVDHTCEVVGRPPADGEVSE